MSCVTTTIFHTRAPAETRQTPGSLQRLITELLRSERHAVLTRLWGEVDRQGAVVQRDSHHLVTDRERLDFHAGERICDLSGVRERVG